MVPGNASNLVESKHPIVLLASTSAAKHPEDMRFRKMSGVIQLGVSGMVVPQLMGLVEGVVDEVVDADDLDPARGALDTRCHQGHCLHHLLLPPCTGDGCFAQVFQYLHK
jgi:hypothetical protein